MSQWTHVCGCIRVDSCFANNMTEVLKKALGKALKFESAYEDWDLYACNPKLFTPTGSEGGVQYDIWENPKKSMMASHTISIFGDLRDFDSIDRITNWFNNVLYRSGLIIRDAVLSIDVEYRKKVVLQYQEDADKCLVCESVGAE